MTNAGFIIPTNHIQSFWEAMGAVGLAPQDPPIDDGELHRFTVEGDKANSKNGWYVLFSGDIPAGSFGSWKQGVTESWCSKSKQDLSKHEQRKHREQMEQARNKRALDQRQQQEEAAVQCGLLWELAAQSVSTNHPYIVTKQIKAYGLRQLNQMLLVPIQDALGRLVNIQFITPDGTKRFKSGGMVKGCYMVIGEQADSIILCEGYSTGATIYQATGQCVVVAFNAGNLLSVARVSRDSNPSTPIIIAADNDHQSVVNIGMLKACEAAKSINALVCWPPSIDGVSDFNDLASLTGLDSVKEHLMLKEAV